MMKKKGSLELSINAIVVIIIAVTMLGLGLAFMKTMFNKAGGTLIDVTGQMESEMQKRFANSVDKVLVSVSKDEMGKNAKKDIALGVKNVLDKETKFVVAAKCSSLGDPAVYDCDSSTVTDKLKVTFFTTRSISSGSIEVMPLKLSTGASVTLDTYLVDVYVKNSVDSPVSGDVEGSKFNEKVSFYIDVK